MAKSAKKAIAFGIVLVALGVIMSAVGGVVKAVQAAELDNYYNNYYGYGNASSQNTKSTTPASSTTTTIYVGNSTFNECIMIAHQNNKKATQRVASLKYNYLVIIYRKGIAVCILVFNGYG